MADIQDRRSGGGGGNVGQIANYKDVAGSTYRAEEVAVDLYGWNATTLQWQKLTVDNATGNLNVTGGSGGGGAVTIADGANVTQGTTTDAAWSGSGSGTVISILKKIASAGGSAVSIADGSNVVEGATTDAAVITDVAGTLSGKMRGELEAASRR